MDFFTKLGDKSWSDIAVGRQPPPASRVLGETTNERTGNMASQLSQRIGTHTLRKAIRRQDRIV